MFSYSLNMLSVKGKCKRQLQRLFSECFPYPNDSWQDREQSCKGMLPFILPRNKTEQIYVRSASYLPTDRVFIAAHEVKKLKSLFDLLEKDLESNCHRSLKMHHSCDDFLIYSDFSFFQKLLCHGDHSVHTLISAIAPV